MPPVETDKVAEWCDDDPVCAICLDHLDGPFGLCDLRCSHTYHAACMDLLRASAAAQQTCPLCRAALPTDPAVLYEGAMKRYFQLEREMAAGGLVPWEDAAVEGLGGEAAEVMDCLSCAAEQGHTEAQVTFGFMCSMGRGVPASPERAFYWYTLSAHQGHPKAQLNLGVLFKLGKGVEQSDAEAAAWFFRAAAQGYDTAQARLAHCYRAGSGVGHDDAEAAYWYALAAEQGNAEAQFALANLHRQGRGLPQCPESAFFWYRQAVEGHAHPHPAAMRNLAFMYTLGQGCTRDFDLAAKWFEGAAELGDPTASTWLASLFSEKDAAAGQRERRAMAAVHGFMEVALEVDL